MIRLHFLFLNVLFSSLSARIGNESVEFPSCMLQSFSDAFSVLSIELGKNGVFSAILCIAHIMYVGGDITNIYIL